MADNEFYDAMVPVTLENGKTIWTKIGTAFPNNKPDKKHKMVLSITSVPLSMFTKDEIKIFVFPQREYQRRPQQQEFPPPPTGDDVPF
jgi:hypothetical protein